MTRLSTRHIALALIVAVLWGLNFIVMKYIVTELPPLGVTGLRFLLAAVPFVFFVPWPNASAQGVIGFGILFGVVKFGLLFTAFKAGMPAGLAALVLQTQALFTILLALVFLGERPRLIQWLGLAVAMVGAAIIIGGKFGDTAFLPVLLTFAAALAWAGANIFLKRESGFDPLGFAVWSSLPAGLVMVALSVLVEGPSTLLSATMNLSLTGWGALAYLVYVISIVTGALWAFLMGRYAAASIAPFALLVPVVGILASWVVYGETLASATIFGGALIFVGLAVNVFGARAAN
ncbi:MAG: hypothetical protein RL291_1809 [Pseudomonadota bacterium]|jgi:O-acetylserine/cysteine efflux transporter